MVVQAFLVGVAIRYKRGSRGPRNIPAMVVVFWLLVGLALVAGLRHYILELDWQGAFLIALKQAVNDILNALIAALALHYLPLRRWAGLTVHSEQQSFVELQTNLFAAFAFMPALVVITLLSRAEVISLDATVKSRLGIRSTAISLNLNRWIDEHLEISQALASQAAQRKNLSSTELHRDLRYFSNASPSIAAVRIVDASGQVVQSSDMPFGAKGADLSSREWFQRLRSDRKPVVALIPKGLVLPEPLVVFVAPVLGGEGENDSLRGGVVLTYKVSSFRQMFAAEVMEDEMRATLVDSHDGVIVSSDSSILPGKEFTKQRGGMVVERMGEVYRWQPEGVKSNLQAWAASSYARQVPIGNSGWSLILEVPLKSYSVVLQKNILNGFITIFLLALGAFLIGRVVGRRIVKPLHELSMETTRLAKSVSRDDHSNLHYYGLSEVDSLVDNFRDMGVSLRKSYRELMEIRSDLELRVQARTADLTHQTEELQRAKDEAESSSRAKSDFLSSMSHEMRTPMNAILGFSQYLEIEDLSEAHKNSVREIYKAGVHLLALIDQVLDLAKIESGSFDLSLEPIEVRSVVDECLTLVEPLADKRAIHIDYSGWDGAAVRADRVRLKQALLNLISNAIKYNREGGSVRLSVVARNAGYLQILVRDTGVGIDAEKLTGLFQAFNRLGAENSAIEGTGIGLTITRRIVEMMGGTVDVESEVGLGSTFWIELPQEAIAVRSERPAQVGAGDVLKPSDGGAQHTVLYIEDNPTNLRLVTQILGRRKHIHLLTAHTPQLGIELALTRRPELILLDINMPGMDGYQVLKRFQAEEKLRSIPVVAITANAMPRDIERGMEAGFTDYLTKPINMARFDAVLDQLLSGDALSKYDVLNPSGVDSEPPNKKVSTFVKTDGSNWETF